MKSKEILNNNKEECSPADNSKLDKDSVMGDCDAILSDLESEGTQPEEVNSTWAIFKHTVVFDSVYS